MSENVSNVVKCLKIFQNVKKCPKMSKKIPKCLKMFKSDYDDSPKNPESFN